jgi:hypothetical protein
MISNFLKLYTNNNKWRLIITIVNNNIFPKQDIPQCDAKI